MPRPCWRISDRAQDRGRRAPPGVQDQVGPGSCISRTRRCCVQGPHLRTPDDVQRRRLSPWLVKDAVQTPGGRTTCGTGETSTGPPASAAADPAGEVGSCWRRAPSTAGRLGGPALPHTCPVPYAAPHAAPRATRPALGESGPLPIPLASGRNRKGLRSLSSQLSAADGQVDEVGQAGRTVVNLPRARRPPPGARPCTPAWPRSPRPAPSHHRAVPPLGRRGSLRPHLHSPGVSSPPPPASPCQAGSHSGDVGVHVRGGPRTPRRWRWVAQKTQPTCWLFSGPLHGQFAPTAAADTAGPWPQSTGSLPPPRAASSDPGPWRLPDEAVA